MDPVPVENPYADLPAEEVKAENPDLLNSFTYTDYAMGISGMCLAAAATPIIIGFGTAGVVGGSMAAGI